MRPSLLLLVALLLGACAVGGADDDTSSDVPGDPAASATAQASDLPAVRVGSGPDPESALLAQIMATQFEREGIAAELVPFSDARDARRAIDLGSIDVRPAYTGEAWLETLGRAEPPSDVVESVDVVREHDERDGIVWFRPRFGDGRDEPPANATFAFAVAGPPSVDAQLETVSQLAARLSERTEANLCVDEEFASRTDGLRAVLAAYSVRSDQPVLAAGPEEAVRGVAAGDCIAGLTTATDGTAWSAGLQLLEDDLGVFPAFVALPQARAETLQERPAVRAALGPIAAQLTTELLGRWNARVVAGETLEEVAEDAVEELNRRAGRDLEDGGEG